MRIDIINRQPVPAIYNVKQYSDAAYEFVFYIPLSALPNTSVTAAAVKTENFSKQLDIEIEGEALVLSWRPDITETSTAGKFELQIEITGSNFVWQSYKAAYIVSSGHIYDPVIYELTDGALSERLETNVSDYVLFPKLVLTETGYEWQAGHNIKTFYETEARAYRTYFKIEKNNIKAYAKTLVSPADISNIAQALTELYTVNGKQLYFVSLNDFTAGFTTISPRAHNKAMSEYTEDMYKCRCLKTSGEASELFCITAALTASARTAETVFYSSEGKKYGFKYKETAGGVKVYKEYDGEEYEDIIFKVYEDEASAEADAENMPEGSVAIIRS